jgi:hypothetical protein
MEILRIAENVVDNAIPASFTLGGEYTDADFLLKVTDLSDLSVTEEEVTASSDDDITVTFNKNYDSSYKVEFYSVDDEVNVFEDTYEVVRPYVDPNTLGTTATEIAAATANEEIARAIIDSIIPDGFYYKKVQYEVSGLGGDYVPLWIDAKKILSVYENNVLIEDRTYEITKDKSAIQQVYVGTMNRANGAPNILPAAQSDSMELIFGRGGFPNGYDYRFVVESGYTIVPSDIVRATILLIEDISCGKLDYYKRYITSYNTEQFRIQFDKSVLSGTGNLIVDKILSKYAKSITRLGVL